MPPAYIYYPNWKEMHPLKESQRINYVTSYILHITYLCDLVTTCNIQKEPGLSGHFDKPPECNMEYQPVSFTGW